MFIIKKFKKSETLNHLNKNNLELLTITRELSDTLKKLNVPMFDRYKIDFNSIDCPCLKDDFLKFVSKIEDDQLADIEIEIEDHYITICYQPNDSKITNVNLLEEY